MPPSSVFAVDLVPIVGVAVPAALGLAAVYLLLPQPGRRPVVAGAVLGVLALLATGVLLSAAAPSVEGILFYVFSAIAIIAGVLLITQRNPARAALSFALVVLSTCGLFLLLAAPFLMAATIIIYAGAIIVTFLFVLMLAQQEGRSDADYRSREPMLASLAGFLLLGTLLYVLWQTYRPPALQELDTQIQDIAREEAQVGELAHSAATGNAPDDKTAQDTLDRLDKSLDGLHKWMASHRLELPQREATPQDVLPDNGRQLDAAVDAAVETLRTLRGKRPVRWDQLQESLASVRAAGLAMRNSFGVVEPPGYLPWPNRGRGTAILPLSDFSGPPANRRPDKYPEKPDEPDPPLQDVRRDAGGRPELPAENVTYLGRSLFTDFLLPIELGGTLLLVATIGAIAIASRRAERTP
jgi:NADH:ubiquinone oxidoreductase subunit 6 (subunit J)